MEGLANDLQKQQSQHAGFNRTAVADHLCNVSGSESAEAQHKRLFCGVCLIHFNTISHLHDHMLRSHRVSGSYSYHFEILTAFPKCESFCQFTQTDDKDFDREGAVDGEGQDERVHENMDVESSTIEITKSVENEENDSLQQIGGAESPVLYSKLFIDEGNVLAFEGGNQSGQRDDNLKQNEPDSSSLNKQPFIGKEGNNDCRKDKKLHRKNGANNSSGNRRSRHKKNSTSHNSRRNSSDTTSIRKDVKSVLNTDAAKSKVKSKKSDFSKECLEQKCIVDKLNVDKPEIVEIQCMKSYNESKCFLCGAKFSVKQALLRHEQHKHFDEMKYKCDHCDKKFMRNFNLQKHVTRVHTQSCKINEEQNDIVKKNVLQSGANAQSTLDDVKVQTDLSVSKKSCRKRRTNAEVEILKSPHTCDVCGRTMPKYKMDVHKRLHTGERPFVCSVCGKGLISQNKLSRHMLIHTEKKKYTCDVCGVGFHMKYKLRMHMHIHTGKKPYLCSVCGAEFNHSANLATHTRCVHLQVKPYECEICGGKYSKRSQLDDHVFSHSAEKKFTCRYCGKSFKYYKGMRRHEKSHVEEGFSCDVCGQKFARKENLDKHKLTHGTSEFQCKVCKKVLKGGRALQDHEFTHLVSKGCKCSSCGEMFYSSNKFFNHSLAVHNIAKHEAQLMIIDEHLKVSSKQWVKSLEKQPVGGECVDKTGQRNRSDFQITEDDSKDTMSLLTRVATENLSLHSQDVDVIEKVNIITPPINPMILYDKNGVTPHDHVTTNRHYLVGPKVVDNTPLNPSAMSDHVYGQKMNASIEIGNACQVVAPPCSLISNACGSSNTSVSGGINESVFGFVTSNSLTSINNLTSYIGQRSNPSMPLSGLAAGLHQDEQGAIESLRRLQDNPGMTVSTTPNSDRLVDNSNQRNLLLPNAVADIDSISNEYRMPNLF